MSKSKDYNGQPRGEDGRFQQGKQNGSRTKRRRVGGVKTSGLFHVPPVKSPKPKHKPGGWRT